MASLKYWIWLGSAAGVSPAAALALLRRFGSPERVYAADRAQYDRVDELRKQELRGLEDKNLDPSEKALEKCAKMGCSVMTIQDAGYPERLKNIYDPPIVLYIRGELPDIDEEAVFAIVGTRKCTDYGLREAGRVAYDVTRRGMLVTTGLARGVDSSAARGALRAGGRVVGVIGSGLDVVYPRNNEKLFDAVAASGAIISEYPPGSEAAPWHFPARNRIISGISVGVAVIEAPERSGALITASCALEQGREVFAMPGNVDAAACAGSNALLRDGAIPLISAADVAAEYLQRFPDKILPDLSDKKAPERVKRRPDAAPGRRAPIDRESGSENAQNAPETKKAVDNPAKIEYIDINAPGLELSDTERRVAEAVAPGGVHIDAIIAAGSLSAPETLAALTMLEIKGVVTQSRGKFFSLARKA
jgi:DNA processing protein